MADYAKKSFGMFGGKEQTVKLLVKNNLVGVIIDRFGKNVILFPTDDEHFTVNVNVHVSRQFLGWVFSLGDGIKIVVFLLNRYVMNGLNNIKLQREILIILQLANIVFQQ